MIPGNKNIKFLISLVLPAILGIISCVEPFEANFDINQRILIVEGSLVDVEGESYVRLRESIPNSGRNSTFLSVKGAKVQVIENGTRNLEFIEGDLGSYRAPKGFEGVVGGTYQLKFELADGSKYESTVETMSAVAPIKRIFQTTEPEGLNLSGVVVPANYIYLDTEDPENEENYYLWSWTLYEKLDVCRSCQGGRFFVNPLPEGDCIQEAALSRRNVIYDYICERPCYQVLSSNSINTQSDQFANGQTISNVLIAKVPYYQIFGGLIEVKQQSLTRGAYTYAKLLEDQGQNTGGLADTPPAGLIGNVKGVSQNEVVSGYFMVSSLNVSRYWIDRTDFFENNFALYGLLGGRSINEEPPVEFRPPLAPCIPSSTRLVNPPEGFKE